MKSKFMKIAAAGGLLTVTALLAGCATSSSSSDGADSAGDYLPCIISDAGGFNDQSFNQLALEGLEEATTTLGVDYKQVESADDTVYETNIQNLVDQDCSFILTVGYVLAEATSAAASSYPDVDFAIIDDNSIDAENVKPVTFNTSQAAFLAGYVSASYSTTEVVATFGGMQIPPVTAFMDGFARGVDYYNEAKGASVSVIGWDPETQNGSFTGDFVAGVNAKSIAQSLIDQGADVILPVGGPIFISAGEAIRDSGKPVALIGVDSDAYESAPDFSDLFLTSIMKGISVSARDVTLAGGEGEFSSEPYVGTLDNGGVGIAPFHDFADSVDPELDAELDLIRDGIADGSIAIEVG
jgi:basic membrane protein A